MTNDIVGFKTLKTFMGENKSTHLPEAQVLLLPVHKGEEAAAESAGLAFSKAAPKTNSRAGNVLNVAQLKSRIAMVEKSGLRGQFNGALRDYRDALEKLQKFEASQNPKAAVTATKEIKNGR